MAKRTIHLNEVQLTKIIRETIDQLVDNAGEEKKPQQKPYGNRMKGKDFNMDMFADMFARDQKNGTFKKKN